MSNVKVAIVADPQYQLAFEQAFSAFELVESDADIVIDACFLYPEDKLEAFVAGPIVITNTLTHSASAYVDEATNTVIGIPMFPNYFNRQTTVEYSVWGNGTTPAELDAFFSALGKQGEKINDCVAGVFPRALAMIVNEAAFALQESVASAVDIDQAMKLGTNYPKGPLAWCDEIGAKAIVATLDALAKEYGSDRYRVASRLRRNAEAGLSFYNKD